MKGNNRNLTNETGQHRCARNTRLDRAQQDADAAVVASSQAHTLESATIAAENGDLEPLMQFLGHASASRRERGLEQLRLYRLWKHDKNVPIVGVVNCNPRSAQYGLLYEREEKRERVPVGKSYDVAHSVVYHDCADQVTCDHLNRVAARFGLRMRVCTKHEAIYLRLTAALASEKIDWVPSDFGGWETSQIPTEPIVVMASPDFDGGLAPALADRRPMPSRIEHLYTEGLR